MTSSMASRMRLSFDSLPEGRRTVAYMNRGGVCLKGNRDGIEMNLGGGWSLQLLSAKEVLEARLEAEELTGTYKERAICSNACLLARALCKDGLAQFSDGAEVLYGLSATEIGRLSCLWSKFNRKHHPRWLRGVLI